MLQIVSALATGILHLALVTAMVGPLVWWSARRRGEPAIGPNGLRTLLLAAVLYVAVVVVWSLPRVGFFDQLTWNWQNKLLVLVALAALVSLLPGVSWHEVGLRRPARGWWIPVLSATTGALAIQLAIGPLAAMPGDVESLLFQATLPGLDEELFFRGILLLLLDRTLRSVRPNDGTGGRRMRWSAIVSCILFGLGHGLAFTDGFTLHVDLAPVVVTGLIGWLLMWVRIRWDSLLPAVLLHNGWNSSVVVANLLAA